MKHNLESIQKTDEPSARYKEPVVLKRIDAHYITHEIQHLLHFEKGFLYTVKELLLRPGKTVRNFLSEDRSRLVKPVIFIIFTSVLFTLIMHSLHINYSYFNIDEILLLKGKIRSKEIGAWTASHMGYTNMIMGVFIALWIKLFFNKSDHNIFEIFVLLCFVMAEALIIFSVFILVANTLDSPIIALVGVLLFFIYITWAVGQFFGERKAINYVKAVLAYWLGNFSYVFILVFIAYFLKITTS